jgi:hypothetical protein
VITAGRLLAAREPPPPRRNRQRHPRAPVDDAIDLHARLSSSATEKFGDAASRD